MRPNWENECVNKSALIEWLRPYLHTGEPIPADVLISDIQMMPPTLTPQNEPLSWAELAEMAGNPVYIVEIGVREYWTLVKYEHNGGVHLMSVNDIDDYGSESLYGKTWLAYRRPPERQEDT